MSYSDLPDFKGPTGYPEARMEEIMSNIRKNMFACSLPGFSRLKPWCAYIREVDSKVSDSSDGVSKQTELDLTPRCYDSFLCDLPDITPSIRIIVLIVTCFSMLGFIGNLSFLSRFNEKENRTGATLYLTFIVISDVLYLFLFWLVFVVRMFPPALSSQLVLYQKWVIYIVPYCLPLFEFFAMVSTWLVVALLVDRFGYISYRGITPILHIGSNKSVRPVTMSRFDKSRSRCRYAIYILIISIFFTIYSVPKFFEYLIDEYSENPKLILMLPNFKEYRIVMFKFLKPTVEYLLPSLLVLWYLILIRDKQHGLKRLSQRQRQRTITNNTVRSAVSYATEFDFSNHTHLLSLSMSECLRKRNEAIVTKIALNLALLIFINLLNQAMCYFVRLAGDTTLAARQLFFYGELLWSVFIVCIKPVVYLITSRVFLRRAKTQNQLRRNLNSFSDAEQILPQI